MSTLLEIACFTPADAVVAARVGANRIEFCKNYDVGGLTPSMEDLELVKELADVPVFVMIRERGGSFVFSEGPESSAGSMKSTLTGLMLEYSRRTDEGSDDPDREDATRRF